MEPAHGAWRGKARGCGKEEGGLVLFNIHKGNGVPLNEGALAVGAWPIRHIDPQYRHGNRCIRILSAPQTASAHELSNFANGGRG